MSGGGCYNERSLAESESRGDQLDIYGDSMLMKSYRLVQAFVFF